MATLSKMHARVLGSGGFRRGELITFVGGRSGGKSKLTTHKEVGHRTEYGWEGPNMPDKGKRGGSCNRTACQRPGAYWHNPTMGAWYCSSCARLINGNNRTTWDGKPLCSLDEEAKREYDERLKA